MKQDILNEMIERAKTKKDGIYQYKSNYYGIYNNSIFAYSNYLGEICERSFGFSVARGKVERYKIKEILRGYLKQLKAE